MNNWEKFEKNFEKEVVIPYEKETGKKWGEGEQKRKYTKDDLVVLPSFGVGM